VTSAPAVMLGLSLPDVDRWSERVTVALGKNPGPFTGPGTNTYLVGTGRRRILLDTGDGRGDYLPVLERALESAGCEGLQEIVLTHGHPDHIGGVTQVIERFGPLPVKKRPWPEVDARYPVSFAAIDHGAVVETEGATLRALHTPGHARDHLCFLLEEERALFSGDNVLGIGTTVIPAAGGSLRQYMRSLDDLLREAPDRIYPAHGPRIEDGVAKLREYIDHRNLRERQILDALRGGARRVPEVVGVVYAAYPVALHAAAGQSVTSHLLKLEEEGRVRRSDGEPDALAASWCVA
jgi:ribonuclease/clavin/mitogillin